MIVENSVFPAINLPDVSHLDVNIFNIASNVDHNKHMMILSDEHQPTIMTSEFTSITNGDCCPHALALCLSFLTNSIPKRLKHHLSLGKCMRETITNYIALNWNEECHLTQLKWHNIVYFAHNLCIPDSEREQFPDWGCTANQHWTGWTNEVDSLYFTTSEILALCEMMRLSDINLPITFRLWRREHDNFFRSGIIPENVGDSKSYVFDLAHDGQYDSQQAHWKLLKSGTAFDANVSNAPSTTTKKRKQTSTSKGKSKV